MMSTRTALFLLARSFAFFFLAGSIAEFMNGIYLLAVRGNATGRFGLGDFAAIAFVIASLYFIGGGTLWRSASALLPRLGHTDRSDGSLGKWLAFVFATTSFFAVMSFIGPVTDLVQSRAGYHSMTEMTGMIIGRSHLARSSDMVVFVLALVVFAVAAPIATRTADGRRRWIGAKRLLAYPRLEPDQDDEPD